VVVTVVAFTDTTGRVTNGTEFLAADATVCAMLGTDDVATAGKLIGVVITTVLLADVADQTADIAIANAADAASHHVGRRAMTDRALLHTFKAIGLAVDGVDLEEAGAKAPAALGAVGETIETITLAAAGADAQAGAVLITAGTAHRARAADHA
jgi:hypothetical protein